MTNYQDLCVEMFGTDDETKIRKMINSNKKKTGRKKRFSDNDVAQMVEMQKERKTTKEIAAYYGVSRQTVSKYLNKAPDGNYSLRMDFLYKQYVCTEIYVDFLHKK